jgi:hypothetical protein
LATATALTNRAIAAEAKRANAISVKKRTTAYKNTY